MFHLVELWMSKTKVQHEFMLYFVILKLILLLMMGWYRLIID